MLKEDLANKSPLRVLNPETGNELDHRMGLVMARAGIGKTAILVQIAMDNMLRGKKVLHVSIGGGLEKGKAWYDDIYGYMVGDQKADNMVEFEDELMRNRMIMTFKESSFSRPKLEERLNDLIYQNIFRPDCVIIDDFNFISADRDALEDVKELAEAMNVQVWFSAVLHRGDSRVSAEGIPAPCHEMGDMFHTVIQLQPQKEGILLNFIKDDTGAVKTGKSMQLDPSTMMVKAS